MLTFLPFLRAVKAPARSLGVCALFGLTALAAGCARGSGAHASEGPPTGPLPVNSPPVSGEPPLDAASDATSLSPATTAAELENQAPRALELSIDLPYAIDAHPRSNDPQQAAADDDELARWNAGGSADPSSASNGASYHPGTRVVVDTRQAKLRPGALRAPAPRGLTLERVQAQTRSRGYWPFRLCFEAGQREKKSLGGETRVAFTIGTRGRVRAARLLASQLRNTSSAACLVREVLKLEFTPQPPRALAMVASIKIWPGDAELLDVPDASSIGLPAGGAFDPELIRTRVADKQAALDACFTEARRADAKLWGRLALSVILEVDGSVHRVSEVESHFPSPSATRCAQVFVSGLLFPSVNGKPFSFVLPLRLHPDPSLEMTQPSSETNPNSAVPSDDAGAD